MTIELHPPRIGLKIQGRRPTGCLPAPGGAQQDNEQGRLLDASACASEKIDWLMPPLATASDTARSGGAPGRDAAVLPNIEWTPLRASRSVAGAQTHHA